MTDAAPQIEIRDLTKEYALRRSSLFTAPSRVKAVDQVSLSITEGTTFGLVGESGSGKTTVAKTILKLEAPTSGSVRFRGEDIFAQDRAAEKVYRSNVQAVLQDPYGALSQRMRVGKIISEPVAVQRRLSRGEEAEIVTRMLQAVGLKREVANRYPHQFSGGQRQRIAIARALSVEPKFLVLDEPVSALDVSIRAQILMLLKEMQERLGVGYLFIGHDLAIVRYMSTHVGVMYFGRMVEMGRAEEVFRRPQHPYSRKLAEVAAGDKPLGGVRFTGELPNPLDPPTGCNFRARCPLASARCASEEPPLVETEPGRLVACHNI